MRGTTVAAASWPARSSPVGSRPAMRRRCVDVAQPRASVAPFLGGCDDRRLWRATPTEGTYAYVLGDAERLGNGNTLSTWGNLGMLVEFDADAEVVWKVNLGLGTIFGFFNLYTPSS